MCVPQICWNILSLKVAESTSKSAQGAEARRAQAGTGGPHVLIHGLNFMIMMGLMIDYCGFGPVYSLTMVNKLVNYG